MGATGASGLSFRKEEEEEEMGKRWGDGGRRENLPRRSQKEGRETRLSGGLEGRERLGSRSGKDGKVLECRSMRGESDLLSLSRLASASQRHIGRPCSFHLTAEADSSHSPPSG